MNPILGNEELRINLKNPIKIISVQEAFADGEEPNSEQPDCPGDFRRFLWIFIKIPEFSKTSQRMRLKARIVFKILWDN